MRALIIGIAGGSGSGKTTVAQRVRDALAPAQVAHVEMDAYYRHRPDLSRDERRRLNWDHPDALDLGLFIAHLDALARGDAVDKPVYDYASHLRRPEAERIGPADVVIVEGILLLTDAAVRERMDVTAFVDADADERLSRRRARDAAERGRPVDEIEEQHVMTVQPMHVQFVEPTRRFADVIISGGAAHGAAVDQLVALVRQRLAGVPS